MARILIADDSRFFRQMLRERCDREAEFEVCGEAENGKQAVEQALKLRPDLIVLDLSMPVMSGIDAASCLTRRSTVHWVAFSPISCPKTHIDKRKTFLILSDGGLGT